MDSVAHKRYQEELHQAEIRRQIAALQAQLVDVSNTPPPQPSKKRTQESVLAPASPSPKRRKLNKPPPPARHPALLPKAASTAKRSPHISKPVPSTLVSKLASITSKPDSCTPTISTRSSGFSERPPVVSKELPAEDNVQASSRDDRLTLIEDLEIGPAEHKAPFNDPQFQKLEPNSGIRLSSRSLPHEELQDYLRGRYYLSPSKLYSVVRLQPNKQGYDVPVEGDWVTIAVVAERGPLRYTKAPVGVGKDDAEEAMEKEDTLDDLPLDPSSGVIRTDLRKWKGKTKEQQVPSKPNGKRYVNLKLVDFGCRASSSSTAGKSVIRGDACLSLLLFESDRIEVIKDEDGKKREIYHGGSRGAYERMAKLREGTVVAFLNPKILKPFQRSADTPHPTNNILALTPESADSTVVIGLSQDLGMCKAMKRDGKVCGSWCDKRVSDVCEYHMTTAVKHNRASRPEFSIGTSGLSTAAKRSKPAFDPARHWGLLPDNSGGGGATYVVSGHVVAGGSDPRSVHVGEAVGREAQAKAARASAKEADRALQKLLQRDKDGMKYVVTARDYEKKRSKKELGEGGGKGKGKGKEAAKRSIDKTKLKAKGKKKKTDDSVSDHDTSSGSSSEEEDERADKKQAKSYSAHLIRNLGFDPTGREGKKIKDTDVQEKLDALAALHASKRNIDLGPRPGKRISTVHAPTASTNPGTTDKTVCLDSDSDDAVEPPSPPPDVKMISLDSSDVE